jgi:hypothetical protein
MPPPVITTKEVAQPAYIEASEWSAVPATGSSPNSGFAASSALLTETTAVMPAATEAHVRFSSDLDVIEAASRVSTSTTITTTTNNIAAAPVPPPTVERHSNTELFDIDVSDEVESNLSSAVRGSGGRNSNDYNNSSGARHGHPQRASVHGSVTDTPALPLLLSPDELQLERLKAYDEAARRPSGSNYSTNVDGGEEEGERGSTHAGGSVDGLAESTSFGSGGSASSPAGDRHGHQHSNNTASPAVDSDVTTLDFLKDTANTILPDAFTSMFASTTHFLKSTTEAMVSAVPQPIRRAMTRTGEGIVTAADATGAMLSNVSAYAIRGVPDRIMSPEWKYLIFVDALNVLKCSLNVNILVAPYIFRMAGLVGGVLLILVMEAVCCYYTEVYFKAKGQLKGADHVIMYGDVPRLTFGRWYPTFQLWYDGIALIATVTYAALNMQALLPHMKITGGAAKALSFIIPSLFSLPFVFMKRARSQPPMMTLASLLVFVSLVMMFVVFPYGSVIAATIGTLEGADRTVAVLHLFPQSAQEFFVALSICVFIFTPLSRAVPVERTMQPRRYIVLLRVCVLISTVVHIAFGVCAIVSYGSNTCSVLSTSFNNNNTAIEVAVMSLLFFAFLFYIPLNMFELGELCDRRMLGWRAIPRYGDWGPNALRLLLLVGCALIAWCIPYYGLLIALSGCLGYSIVALVIPAALDYVCRTRYGLLRSRTPRFLDYVITFSGVTLGAIICLVGVVMTTYEMWLVVQSGYSTTC